MANRLNRLIEEDSFDGLPARKRVKIVERLRSMYSDLLDVVGETTLKQILAVAAVVVLGFSAGCGGEDKRTDADTEQDSSYDVLPDDDGDAIEDPLSDTVMDTPADTTFDDAFDTSSEPDVDSPDATDTPGDDVTPLIISFAASVQEPFGFVPPSAYFLGLATADIDDDGDLDLFGIKYGEDLLMYENTGTSTSPAFAAVARNPFGFTATGQSLGLGFADLDGDGDLDLLVGEPGYSGTSYEVDFRYLENTGTAAAPAFGSPAANPFGLTTVPIFIYTALEFMDIDGDGDSDLLVSGYDDDVEFLENTGTPSSPSFATAVANPFGLTATPSGGYISAPAAADLDFDGDLDVLLGQSDDLDFLENTGSPSSPAFASPVAGPFGLSVSNTYFHMPEFADMDGDGDPDLFVYEYYGSNTLLYFENTTL